jgi:hypothetical protein
MKIFRLVTPSLVLLSLVISACGGMSTEIPTNPEVPIRAIQTELDFPVSTPFPTAIASRPPSANNADVFPEEILKKAITDLAERLGISEDQVQVIDAKAVTWPDASLGCPQPGMVYAQVTTPGYWILLEALENRYPYHTDVATQIILCQGDFLPIFSVTPGEIDDGQPWMPVD